MKLITLVRDCPLHGGFAGETMGFADDVAAKLVKSGKAAYVARPVVEPEPVPVNGGLPDTPVDDDADGGDGDSGEPKKRGPGRPRKAD